MDCFHYCTVKTLCSSVTITTITVFVQDDEHTCHGENISEAAAAAAASDQVVAVGINCTQPEYISNLLRNISDDIKRKKSIVVYPNSGEDWSDAR